MKALFFMTVMFFFIGCAPQGLYYFGDYSQTLYNFEKSQNEESYIAHKIELENIISESEGNNLRIPPGICAELGYIHLKANKPEDAIGLFIKEYKLYPESKHFMDRLIQRAHYAYNADDE